MTSMPFTVRALAFVNHVEVGSYPAAVSAFLSGQDPHPDLARHLSQGSNYGFGLNGETAIGDSLRLFSRFGWNEGTKEGFQFAEADRTFAIGGDSSGKAWNKPTHRIGMAFAVNALVPSHREYLALGGQSYLLGDGGLDYGHEKVLEAYYNVPLRHGFYAAFDVHKSGIPDTTRFAAQSLSSAFACTVTPRYISTDAHACEQPLVTNLSSVTQYRIRC